MNPLPDQQPIKLTVIIPCFNAAGTIARQLSALAEQQWQHRWEVIVSDNGSSDDSLAIVNKFKDRLELRVVDASARRGASYARNVGASAARGISLAFCDADDEVDSDWVAAMGKALCKYDFVACRLDFAKLNQPWVSAVFRDNPQQSGLQKAWFPPYLPHAGGGTIGVKKWLHESVGGFDESLRAQEDTDYCFRIQRRETELHFVSDALLHISCRSTLRGLFQQARCWADATVLISKLYRPETTTDLGWNRWLRHCRQLIYLLPALYSKTGRALWIWQFGWQLGRFEGGLKYRVPPV